MVYFTSRFRDLNRVMLDRKGVKTTLTFYIRDSTTVVYYIYLYFISSFKVPQGTENVMCSTQQLFQFAPYVVYTSFPFAHAL